MKNRKKICTPSRQNIADILNNNETQELNLFACQRTGTYFVKVTGLNFVCLME